MGGRGGGGWDLYVDSQSWDVQLARIDGNKSIEEYKNILNAFVFSRMVLNWHIKSSKQLPHG